MSSIQKHDIIEFLNNLPPKMKIILKKDMLTELSPGQIVEHIENKTNVGKAYFLQIAKVLDKKKIKKDQKLDVIM